MWKFPTLCVDDFYKEPDIVRKFALEQDFCVTDKEWPGRRTKLLNEIDTDFFGMFCEKLFSIYYDFETSYTEWEVLTSFQLVPPFSPDEKSYKNLGFIHKDDYEVSNKTVVCAGIIYLTPNINKNCGTSIFKLKEGVTSLDGPPIKQNLYGKGIDTDFDKYMEIERNKFEEITRFYNVYNRLISFDSAAYHGVNSFYSEGEPRLTQTFFVARIDNKSGYPLERSNRRNLL